MSKARQLLTSIRCKHLTMIKRIVTCSNCIRLIIFLFIAFIVFYHIHSSKDELSSSKLDKFESANFIKASYVNPVPLNIKRNNGIHPRSKSKIIQAKEEIEKGKKAIYRSIFEALAHPRFFPQTTMATKFRDVLPTVGLNDWIQANSPRDKDKFLVYSAYWDDRFENYNNVRVMAVMITIFPPTVFCRLLMSNNTYNDVRVTRNILNEHWRLRYASYRLSCEVPKKLPPPSKVLLSLNRNFTHSALLPVFRNKEESFTSPKGHIAVCVKPLHYYYNRATWLAEFIELHRMLGAEHFFFYNHSVGQDVDILLRYYMQKNIVTALPWNLPVKSQKEIRTEGIFSSLNDCLFRTMYLFQYVLMLDFDEYIIPREHNNYFEMLEKLEEASKNIRVKPGRFVFRNTFFYLYWENDTTLYGVEPEKPPDFMPYLITQYKTRRMSAPMKPGNRSKYIVVPDRALQVGNHFVWEHTSGSRAVLAPDTVALLHHYSICEFGGFSCLKRPTVVDRSAYKFGRELLSRVLEQCGKIYPELERKCPVSPPLGSPW